MARIVFEYEGKRYEAEAGFPYVRLPCGTALRVVNADGGMSVTLSNKKNPPADEVSTASEAPPEAATVPSNGTPAPEVSLAALKAAWDATQERILAATRDQQAVESSIAAHLVTLRKGQSRSAAPPSVVLGSKRYKAQKARDGGAHSLVVVPEYADAG